MKIEKFVWEQMKLGTFSMESEKLSEIGAKSETEGNASLPQGGLMPVLSTPVIRKSSMAKTYLHFSGFMKMESITNLQTWLYTTKIDPSLADGRKKTEQKLT